MKKIAEASQAIADAVQLCDVKVVPMFPITPQTHIVERIADKIANKTLKAKSILVESEHSAISAAIGASATGARTFTATSSQGLALMHEILFIASGLRLPIVMAVANRALSSPINIWADHSDTMAQRDTGWIQLYCESSQEAYDTIIQAYKIAETCSIPVMVCIDGFTLSHLWEPIETIKSIKQFLPKFNPENKLNPNKPITLGAIAYPEHYQIIKQQQQKDILNSIQTIKKVNSEFKTKFKRNYGNGLIETYKTKDAEIIYLAMGTTCGTLRVTIDELRKNNKKIGLIKLKTFRPFPTKELQKAIKNAKIIKVIDRAVSYGNQGPLFTEIKAITDKEVHGFITGLGGKDITIEILKSMLNKKGGWI